MRRTITLGAVTRALPVCGLLCAVLVFLTGCPGPPWFDVDSYGQLKEELATDQPGIIYPDISGYERAGTLTYRVCLYQQDRNIKNGFEIYSRNDGFNRTDDAPVCSSFLLACFSIEQYTDDLNPCPPLEPTMRHRSIGMRYDEQDNPASPDGGQSDQDYPEGSRMVSIEYVFDLEGYRYSVAGGAVLTPDDLRMDIYKERVARARDELLAIVDDILDQGGIPR